MEDRGGAIAGMSGEMEYQCDKSKPNYDAVIVITTDSRCRNLGLTVDYISADTTVNLYDGSTLYQARTCGRM